MALAWPSFQPITLPSVPRAWTMSSGFIIMICPVDKPVLSFPSAEIVVASMLSPKLPAKAAEIYMGNIEALILPFFRRSFLQLSDVDHNRYVQYVDTCGSSSVQIVVRLCRTIILSSEVSWENAGPGATHRHKSGRLQEQQ